MLKGQFQTELNNPFGIWKLLVVVRYHRGDLSNLGGREIAIGSFEIYVVQHIEELRPDLHLDPLRQLCILQKAQVRVEVSRPAEDVPAGSPESSHGVLRELRNVEPPCDHVGMRPIVAQL